MDRSTGMSINRLEIRYDMRKGSKILLGVTLLVSLLGIPYLQNKGKVIEIWEYIFFIVAIVTPSLMLLFGKDGKIVIEGDELKLGRRIINIKNLKTSNAQFIGDMTTSRFILEEESGKEYPFLFKMFTFEDFELFYYYLKDNSSLDLPDLNKSKNEGKWIKMFNIL